MQSITKGCENLGYTGAAMDKLIGGMSHDLLSWAGFMHAVCLILSVRRGGLLWMGPPCGNFIWMSRAATKRTISNPLGTGPKAKIANLLTSRWVFLAWLANAIGIYVIIEQPESSILWEHPDVKELLRLMPNLCTVATEMGAFGSNVRKRLCLKGTPPWLPHLSRKCSWKDRVRITLHRGKHGLVRRGINKAGKPTATGIGNLTASAAYPKEFGKLVGIQFSKFCLQSGFGTDGRPVVVKDFDGAAGLVLPAGTFDDVWQRMRYNDEGDANFRN